MKVSLVKAIQIAFFVSVLLIALKFFFTDPVGTELLRKVNPFP